MNAKLVEFGRIDIGGRQFDRDVVIDAGKVRARVKKPSKAYRAQYGHTPLSAEESLPWGGKQLIVGTGVYGSLPIMPAVGEEARRRCVQIVALPTDEACEFIRGRKAKEVYAVLHITC